jgi:hypothetical protein
LHRGAFLGINNLTGARNGKVEESTQILFIENKIMHAVNPNLLYARIDTKLPRHRNNIEEIDYLSDRPASKKHERGSKR